MTQSTINGFDLLTIFQGAINKIDRVSLSFNPALAGVQVETPLTIFAGDLPKSSLGHCPEAIMFIFEIAWQKSRYSECI